MEQALPPPLGPLYWGIMDISKRPGGGNGRHVTLPVSGTTEASVKPLKRSRWSKFTAKLVATSWRQRVLLGVGSLIVATGLFFAVKVALAARKVIAHNNTGGAVALSGKVTPSTLKGEGDGRINILLLGIGGKGWDGPYLSDTMMVVSIDPQTKKVAMLSVPRDLYVKIPGYGWSKINAADAIGEEQGAGDGPPLSEEVVQNILGIPIQYYARVDFSGFKQAINTVGGIDLNVPTPLYDPYYPGGTVNFKAGFQHMNATQALEYARSRKTTSDFDRAARQQQILLALKSKALTLNTLINPAKLAGLIDAFGDSFRTDLQISDMKQLYTIAQGINSSDVTTKVLDTSPGGLLVVGNIPGAGSIEVPATGLGNYTAIQAYARSIFTDSYITSENATIEVQNGTLQSGLATSVGTLLKSYNYNVTSITTAAQQNHAQTVIYDYTGGKKPYTINYLENRFNVKAQKAVRGPSDPDIRIIIGSDYKPPSSN